MKPQSKHYTEQDYDEFLNSQHRGYDNYQTYQDENKLAFNYNDPNIVTANLRTSNANTRRGYAFNDYQDLVDLVGSKNHKDIRMKQAFMSPASFDLWKKNPKYPSRAKWSSETRDVDGDGIGEFLVKDKKGNVIGVNGYYMANTDYPYRYAYQDSVERNEKGRPNQKFKEWMETQTGMKYTQNALDMTYDDQLQNSKLYKMWDAYGDASKKFPKKVRAYKHFTSYLFPLLSTCAKLQMMKGCSKLNVNQTQMQYLAECVKYPGETAVQAARFYTAQCFYAWNVYMMQPILHLDKIRGAIEKEYDTVEQLMKTDTVFAENHQGEDITKLAVARIKTRKWFKDVVDKIYTKLLNDQASFSEFIKTIVAKFINDYKYFTNDVLLFNEDKLRILLKRNIITKGFHSRYQIGQINFENIEQSFSEASSSSSMIDSNEVNSSASPIPKVNPQPLPQIFGSDNDTEQSEFEDVPEPKQKSEKRERKDNDSDI